ncbi:MAG TPA: pyridoxal-phosphate dependent enzyme [bacterium]|nr:pyridoxal-phosphate dependent enzyme [bacterium]
MYDGIWRFPKLRNSFERDNLLSLNEGNTPLQEVAGTDYGIPEFASLYLKREDLNTHGSHKDRMVAFFINKCTDERIENIVLSSSGNAGISMSHYAAEARINLDLFLSPKTPQYKLDRIHPSANIHYSMKAKSAAIRFANEKGYYLFRGSKDKHGITGLKSIPYEIREKLEPTDIFLPVSSGNAALGIYYGYKDLYEDGEVNKIPRIHILQTERVHPHVKFFYKERNFHSSRSSVARAIVDRVGHRKKEIRDMLLTTSGKGFILSDKEILAAHEIMLENGVKCSTEGSMGLAAISKIINEGDDILLKMRVPLIIVTGKGDKDEEN